MQCNDKRYDSLEKLEKHCKRCVLGLEDIEEILPTKNRDDILKFKNVNCTFKHPFYITADFESTLEKVDDNNKDNKSQIYQHHIANSYGLKYNCDVSEHSENVKIFNCSDKEILTKNYVEELERLTKKSYDLTQLNKDNIIMTNEQKILHKKNTNCMQCNCFYTVENKKIRHHNHLNGQFISSLCTECNLKLQ